MQHVTDISGQDWFLDLNLGIADKVDAFLRDAYHVDLFDAVQVMGLLARPINVVSIASCLCSEDREKRGLSPMDFGRLWKGEAAYKLQRALWEEYRDFFPDPRIAALIASTMTQLEHLSESEEMLVKKAMEKLTEAVSEAVTEMQSTIAGESVS